MFLKVIFMAGTMTRAIRRLSMKRYHVSVGDPQAERLEEDAKAEGIPVQELIRRIISEHYKKITQAGQK
jgi:hypothetical protein